MNKTMRWDKIDNKLIKCQTYLNGIFNSKIKTSLIRLYDSFFSVEDYSNIARDYIIRDIDYQIKELGNKQILASNYIKALRKRPMTYYNCLEILVYLAYANNFDEINNISNQTFVEASNDGIDQLRKDTNIEFAYLEYQMIEDMLVLTTLGITYSDYLENILNVAQYEAYRNIITDLQAKQLDEAKLNKMLLKQKNRLVNIHDDKHSGVIDDIVIKVENESYVEPLKEVDDLLNGGSGGETSIKVVFVAEMDERTTPMCRSLDGQEFYVNNWNNFNRVADGNMQHYRIMGLVSGINLPPISHFEHWCRSFVEITKQSYDILKENYKKILNESGRVIIK